MCPKPPLMAEITLTDKAPQAHMPLANDGLEATFSEHALSRALFRLHHLGKRYLIGFLDCWG